MVTGSALAAWSTDLFVSVGGSARQLVRVDLGGPAGAQARVVVGRRDSGEEVGSVQASAGSRFVDVPVMVPGSVGDVIPADARVGQRVTDFDLVIAEPGWSIHLVPHFHFDPVWWNTQAASVSEWGERQWSTAPQLTFQKSAFAVLDDHLRLASVDPDYRFVVAEVDYLKPYLDRWPERRDDLARLMRAGRVEVVGGTWNEPDTVLPGLETIRRSFEFGLTYQRGVLGANVKTGWALDVFGHAPQFPALAAEAGLEAVALARGPFHQWGLLRDGPFAEMRDVVRQHAADVSWTAPGGASVQLHTLPGHYTAGHPLDAANSVEEAEELVLQWLKLLRPHAAGRTVVVPVGTDLAPPVRWVTALVRRFAARYAWPRVHCSVPGEALARIRAETSANALDAEASGHAIERLRAYTRDLNPIYTGKDVTYADVKAANAAVERLALDVEAAAAWSAPHAQSAVASHLDRAWRLLAWLAHHDAVTGTCSDQVYLDLLTGWKEANDALVAAMVVVGEGAGDSGTDDTMSVLVYNCTTFDRHSEVVALTLDLPDWHGLRVVDEDGDDVAHVVEAIDSRNGRQRVALRMLVSMPGMSRVEFRMTPGPAFAGWEDACGAEISNEVWRVVVDAARGGVVSILQRHGRDLLAPGEPGGELVVDTEHPTHPDFGEGPWHLMPTGERARGSERRARVRSGLSAIGQRLVVEGDLPHGGGAHRTTYFLPRDGGHPEVSHRLTGFTASDRLLRARWPLRVPGARPVVEVGEAVIGRSPGFPRSDAAEFPWTLDTAAQNFVASGSTARLVDGAGNLMAFGVAEVIAAPAVAEAAQAWIRALARVGVTATWTSPWDARCGDLARDTTLLDLRWVLRVGSAQGVALRPGVVPRLDAWSPGADLSADDAVPAVEVTAPDGEALLALVCRMATQLAQTRDVAVTGTIPLAERLEDRTVALASRDVRSVVVEADGTMSLNLRRSCLAWPAAQWLDPPRRGLPDGESFAAQRWSHEVHYALLAGEGPWSEAGIAPAASVVRRPLRAVPLPIARGPREVPAARSGALVPPAGVEMTSLRTASDGALLLRLHTLRPTEVRGVLRVHPALNVTTVAERHQEAHPDGHAAATEDGWEIRVPPVGSVLLRLERRCPLGDLAPVSPPPLRRTFSRWWTQNSGPPPDGLPLAVHLRVCGEASVPSAAHKSMVVDLLVVSDLAVAAAGTLQFELPVGVRLSSDSVAPRAVEVPARGYVRHRLHLRVDSVAAPMPSAVVSFAPERGVAGDPPPTWDIAHLGPHRTADLVELLEEDPAPIVLAPGGSEEVALTVCWRGTVAVDAELHLALPYDAWPLAPRSVARACLTPGSTTTLSVPLVAQPGHAGRWWVVPTVRVADRVLYGPTRELRAETHDLGSIGGLR